MPKLQTTTTGLWPKIGGSAPSLRAALHQADQQKITPTELEKVFQANLERAVTEQATAGIDLINEGLIRAADLFAPLVAAWSGLTRRGIHRYLDTNTLYGEPVVESALEFQPTQTSQDFAYAHKLGARKAVLPGPFTFAAACIDNFYPEPKALRQAITQNLKQEIQNLVQAGAELIELQEPALAYTPSEAQEIQATVAQLAPVAPVIWTTYFRNFDLATARAIVAGGGLLGLDLTTNLSFALAELPTGIQQIQFGAINTRETQLEDATHYAKIQKQLQDFAQQNATAEIWLSTNTSVEFLPHDRALKKVQLLQELKEFLL